MCSKKFSWFLVRQILECLEGHCHQTDINKQRREELHRDKSGTFQSFWDLSRSHGGTIILGDTRGFVSVDQGKEQDLDSVGGGNSNRDPPQMGGELQGTRGGDSAP